MIAEINNKISKTGSNLSDRLEDQFTGNFFGNMRYLPFNKGLKAILLECISPKDTSEHKEIVKLIEAISLESWSEKVIFWKAVNKAELDVIIEFDELIIGVEVKYRSGLSSDDEVDNSNLIEQDIESSNQLARESSDLVSLAKGKHCLLLLFADESACRQIYNNVLPRDILSGIKFGYVTWQDTLIALKKLHNSPDVTAFEKIIIEDLIKLFEKKGFDRFNDFYSKINGLSISRDVFWSFTKNNEIINFNTDKIVLSGVFFEFKM